jgi:membrane-bound lytic murein transglycosylase A
MRRIIDLTWIAWLLLPIIIMSGCAAPTREALVPVRSSQLPSFADDMHFDGLEHSIRQSISYLEEVGPDREFVFGNDRYSSAHMILSLETFLTFIHSRPSSREMRQFLRENYRVYRSSGKDGNRQVLFTGYYEPFLKGTAERNGVYTVPIYGRPDDLVRIDLSLFSERFAGETIVGRLADFTLVPYHDRRQIEKDGLLDGRAPVLAWLKDPVDLFFLQIQGSGRIFLENGAVLNVHYDSTNGHPYRSIGRLLIDEGKIPKSEMSMQQIRAYLRNHPEEREAILYHNPSYVFFKLESDGPIGYLEVKLTPGRSLAVDYRLFPLPALAYIETEKPLVGGSGEIIRWKKFSRFAVSQDTGGAIRGPARSDLFWGNGTYAEIAAGHMQHKGRLYFLVLKPEMGSPAEEAK